MRFFERLHAQDQYHRLLNRLMRTERLGAAWLGGSAMAALSSDWRQATFLALLGIATVPFALAAENRLDEAFMHVAKLSDPSPTVNSSTEYES